MLRICLTLLVIFVLAFVGTASADSPFNVDCFFGWGGCYRPMEWTPVEIGISSTLTEPFAGSLNVSAKQDGLNTLNITHTFVLTPDVPLHIPLVTKLAFALDKCSVRISDQHGRTRWRHDFELWDFSPGKRTLTAIGQNDLFIGLIGRRKFGLLSLSKQSACKSETGRGKVYLKDKLPRMVPWDWTGFVSLDLLILYDPDWNLFNKNQLNAIAQWISNGGKLLLILGSRPLLGENPIAELLPFEVQQAKQISVTIDELKNWGLNAANSESVVSWPLKPKPGAQCYKTDDTNNGECLFATGYVGFGRVGVLAFDPSTMTEFQKTNSAQFWVSRIAAILEDSDIKTDEFETKEQTPNSQKGRRQPNRKIYRGLGAHRSIAFAEDVEGNPDNPQNDYQYNIGQAQAGSNAVMEYLYSISELRPLSIWWVILLLTLLAVLLGPVDYIVLKRMNRLPLTWVTSAFWIILFSAGAYYGVQALRGGKMQFRIVSVLDGIKHSDRAWSTVYCGLFAPHSDDYQLKDLDEKQWWSGIAPAQEHLYAYRQQTGSRNIYCFQHDGSNLPYSLPINIWTMQCLMNESPVQQLPIDARIERRGDEIFLTIINQSESPIKKGYVLFDKNQAISFGPVSGYSTEDFSERLKPYRGWEKTIIRNPDGRYRYYMDGSQSEFKNETAYSAQGCLRRTQTIEAYLAKGAAVVCAKFDQAPVSFAVKDLSCDYNHTQLVRLVVFPK
ncbi:MAG: hypothetical protein FVQ85_03110 [Planctomycetes bacterium]|nr:hypothetical protein [Planctomycetota bacterium]